MELDKKITELAQKYQIPEELFREARKLEIGKDTLQNRKLVPRLIALIEKYTDSSC
jgi:hypothetical protein